MSQITLKKINKIYKSGKVEMPALREVSLEIEPNSFVSIVGPSGCGKSTMLNMITGIDKPSTGEICVGGLRLNNLSEDKIAKWRGKNIGIIFQFFQLFPTLTALENASLPMDFVNKKSKRERKDIARKNLELVGLGDKLNYLPSELSGGQQQRVAIARALANDPEIIIGDEPTGNLDSHTAMNMFNLFRELHSLGKSVIFVTHSVELAQKTDRVVRMLDGQIVN